MRDEGGDRGLNQIIKVTHENNMDDGNSIVNHLKQESKTVT